MTALCRLQRDTSGVSPVIGTVLVLAISVLGIAGILAWGAPTIDKIQSRNSQTAMEGEFEGLRDASQELSVPDHSRFPTVSVPGGSLALQPGTRFLVAADHDSANTGCDFHVTGWSTAGTSSVTIAATGCRTPTTTCPPASGSACLEIFSVGGSTTVKQTATLSGSTATVSPAVDFSKNDWMFRLSDGATTPTVYAEAWLHSTDQVSWTLKASSGDHNLYLDGGAVFSSSGGTYFLEKEATIGDTSYGNGYYGLWLRSLLASGYSALDGQGSHQVFLSLLGNSVRVDSNAVTKLRFDFSGALAQSWCNALVNRDSRLVTTSNLFFAVYKADPSFPCTAGGTGGLRSVCFTEFTPTATPTSTPCTTAGTAFQFRFLHARIDTSLSV